MENTTNKVNWPDYHEISGCFNLVFCKGDEKHLSLEEISAINEALASIKVKARKVNETLYLAKGRNSGTLPI